MVWGQGPGTRWRVSRPLAEQCVGRGHRRARPSDSRSVSGALTGWVTRGGAQRSDFADFRGQVLLESPSEGPEAGAGAAGSALLTAVVPGYSTTLKVGDFAT